MCGIAGKLHLGLQGAVKTEVLQRMTAALRHRGPDGEGIWVEGPVGFGHQRLAIIDLSPRAGQPMTNEDGSLRIVFNGEIYNFQSLREDLQQKGHVFHSESDTETILHFYEEEGVACLQRLRGMFAFALWDAKHRTLFLARDRLGKKPLYYYRDGNRFIFASEIKAILAHPEVPRQVNHQVLPLYLSYGYVPAPYTMFADIYELPPGHFLTVQAGQVSVHEYWDVHYPSVPHLACSEQESIERVRGLLQEAVRARLISDVPLGAFLSGGLDSTAVVACMARLGGQPVKTFAVGFADDPSFNELEYARMAARAYGTDHHEFVVRPAAVELLTTLVYHYDQPFADSSAIPTYLVSRLTREHVTVVLTGDGGDELFAGYERFAAARLAEVYRHTPQFLQAALTQLLHTLPESTSYKGFVRRARRFVENAPLPLALRYLGWVTIFNDGFIHELLASSIDADPAGHFRDYFERVRGVDPIGQLLYVNTKTYLPGDLLVKTDRMTMANSLEARCPFLDQEFLEFAARIPSNLKLKGLTTKYILKKPLEGLVPREIIHRRKHGFGVPLGRWFRTDLKDYVREVLLSPRALRRGYFREGVLRRLVDEHQNSKRDHGHRLWSLLTLEMWHRVFIDRESNA
jgi:asparagine synthase (glutamine-hydrolysing)